MSEPAKLHARLQSPHLPALDGLRAVAVLLVIFHHFGFEFVPGAHGVMTFFVLSGFLITWLLVKENERDGGVSLTNFYKRRVLRIFPAFYVCWLLLVLLLMVTGKEVHWPHAWSSFFYASNYYIALNGDPNNGFSHPWPCNWRRPSFSPSPSRQSPTSSSSARSSNSKRVAGTAVTLRRFVGLERHVRLLRHGAR